MTDTQGYFVEDLKVGQKESITKTVSDADIHKFAEITGDTNPVHLDDAYAKGTMFKQRIAHGMLSAGYISAVLGTRLPGPGCIYMSQSMKFKAPVKIGDAVTTTVTVKEINLEKKRVTLDTICAVGETVVLEGEALLMVPSKA